MTESQFPYRVQQYNLRLRVAITPKLTGAALFAASVWSAVLAVTLPVPLGAVPAVKETSKDIVRQVRKLLEHG
jgi:hypothetical protein